jgi:2-hydroxychromene-2-carboxylate isomerase
VPPPAASFYFDLFSPHAYVTAEQLPALFGATAEWTPVLARELAQADSLEAFRCAEEESIFRAEVERRAAAHQLQPVVWPDPFPFDSELAMLVATFAKTIGRVVAFSLAAFRQAYAGGQDLSQPTAVLIAAAACEMHPQAVLTSARRGSIAGRLRDATDTARARGVTDVPALVLDNRLLVGSQPIEQALGELQA